MENIFRNGSRITNTQFKIFQKFRPRNSSDPSSKSFLSVSNSHQSTTRKIYLEFQKGHIQQNLVDQNSKVQIAILGWLNYQLNNSSHFSKEIWSNSNFLTFCSKQVKQSNEHRGRYANILATSALSGEKKIDFHHPQTEKNFREVLSNLCDALREQFRQGFGPIRSLYLNFTTEGR